MGVWCNTRWEHHGAEWRKTYLSWRDMRTRCYNENNRKFEHYGARGITVCDRWRENFDAFVADMGKRPEGLTLERVDNEKGYEPSNCVWATYSAQNRNQRRRKDARRTE